MNDYDTPCDLCGSLSATILFARDRHGRAVDNVVCDSCGLVFVKPRPSPADLAELYRSGAFSVEARGSAAPSTEKLESSEAGARARLDRLDGIAKELKLRPGLVLEVGCGVGSFLGGMQERGWRVVGIEPDPLYAAAGRETFGIEVFAALYEEVDLAEPVDLLAAFHVIEHVASPRAFLEKASRELRVGGLMYLEVPCIERPLGGDLERFFWLAHLHTFSARTLTALLSTTGHQVIEKGYVGDNLWIVARSSRRVVEPHLPVEDPAEVIRSAHALHDRHQRRHRRIRARLRRALSTSSLGPCLRRLRRWGRETPRRGD